MLVIQTDQQSAWTLGAYGGTIIPTPHIDGLGKQGVVLENFLTNSAVCTPSRGCLVSGLYPHVNGSIKNNDPLKPGTATFASVLKAAGYRTGYAGKWHLAGRPKPGWMGEDQSFGFSDCRYMFNRGHWKTILDQQEGHPKVLPYGEVGDEKTFTTDWLTGKTEEFLALSKDDDRPFLWMVALPDPHPPLTVRAPYAGRFKAKDMPLPSTLFEENKPRWARRGPLEKQKQKRNKKGVERWLRQRKAKYCDMIPSIDDAVGRLLAAVEATGRAEDTIVIFTTDHGEYMGEHGLMNKNQIYDAAYRIPFIVRWPGGLPAGRREKGLVAQVDVMPTILGLCGAEIPAAVQGRDASKLLRGGDDRWANEVWQHHSSTTRAGIFTDRYQLSLINGSDHVLFDRVEDPEQKRNLYADPERKSVVDELTARVVAHHKATKSPATEWLVG